MKVLALNRRAKFNFEIIEQFTAGINLLGAEVKAIREGKMSLAEAFCLFKKDGIYLINAHIGQYSKSSQKIDPYRERKLLLTNKEMENIKRLLAQKNLSLIPLKVLDKKGWIKMQIGIARKKKKKDKKEILKQKAIEKEIKEELKYR